MGKFFVCNFFAILLLISQFKGIAKKKKGQKKHLQFATTQKPGVGGSSEPDACGIGTFLCLIENKNYAFKAYRIFILCSV